MYFAGVRPVPLDIHIMGFDIVNFDARLQAMSRPTYSGLVNASTQVQSHAVKCPAAWPQQCQAAPI